MSTTNILDLNNRIDALEKKQDQDTTDYEQLSNLPKINNVELKGNKTTSDLLISYNDITDKPTIPTSASGIAYDNTGTGLTATDVQGAVDEVAGKMGNMKMTKLWENPSPASDFAAQTVILSGSNYDLLLIIAIYATTFGDNISNISSGTSGYISFGLASTNGPANYVRPYSVNGNQVTFSDCKVSTHNAPSKVTANNTLIPHQIYGIKLT